MTIARCHGLSLPMNRVCTGQSSDSERASAEWQSAAVTPQFNTSCSLVSRVSKHLIEFIAIYSVGTSKEPVCPRVELILKIIIILLIIFLGFIKSKPC